MTWIDHPMSHFEAEKSPAEFLHATVFLRITSSTLYYLAYSWRSNVDVLFCSDGKFIDPLHGMFREHLSRPTRTVLLKATASESSSVLIMAQ